MHLDLHNKHIDEVIKDKYIQNHEKRGTETFYERKVRETYGHKVMKSRMNQLPIQIV